MSGPADKTLPTVVFVDEIPPERKGRKHGTSGQWKGYVVALLTTQPNRWARIENIQVLQVAPYVTHLRNTGAELGLSVETALRDNILYARVVEP